MQKIFLLFILSFSSTVFAQTKTEWPEKENFHTVMAQTFHPMEDGNYLPIRERSLELYEKALAWQKSSVPAGFSKEKLKKKLKKLVEETKDLNEDIKGNCTDSEIKEDLTELHDLFHTIVGLCKHD